MCECRDLDFSSRWRCSLVLLGNPKVYVLRIVSCGKVV